jgi:hypothetical protein
VTADEVSRPGRQNLPGRFLFCLLALLASGCPGSCGKPAEELTVVRIPAFGTVPEVAIVLDVDPKPPRGWEVTPLANAVYLATKACPEDLSHGQITARFDVADGKTGPSAEPRPGGAACVERAVLGRGVTGLPMGSYRVVAHVVPHALADAGR